MALFTSYIAYHITLHKRAINYTGIYIGEPQLSHISYIHYYKFTVTVTDTLGMPETE